MALICFSFLISQDAFIVLVLIIIYNHENSVYEGFTFCCWLKIIIICCWAFLLQCYFILTFCDTRGFVKLRKKSQSSIIWWKNYVFLTSNYVIRCSLLISQTLYWRHLECFMYLHYWCLIFLFVCKLNSAETWIEFAQASLNKNLCIILR